ncbi:MAG TPA: hypothetical protein VIQ05_16010 [Tardiphaga sp.]
MTNENLNYLLPLPIDTPCAVCGTVFQNFLRKGRPQLFCSAPCRNEQSRQQRNAWARNRTKQNTVSNEGSIAMPKPNPRAEIVKSIEANASLIERNLGSLWRRTAEDLAAGGVDKAALANSIFDAATTIAIETIGVDATVEHLRKVADLFESFVEKNPKYASTVVSRH